MTAICLALAKAGSNSAINKAMMDITTSSSMSVKPRLDLRADRRKQLENINDSFRSILLGTFELTVDPMDDGLSRYIGMDVTMLVLLLILRFLITETCFANPIFSNHNGWHN